MLAGLEPSRHSQRRIVKVIDEPDAIVVQVTAKLAEPEPVAAPIAETAEPEVIGKKAAEEEEAE